MENPLIKSIGNNMDFFSQFEQFKQTIHGDPKQIVQQMLNRGQITQEQLNSAMEKANQMMRFIK